MRTDPLTNKGKIDVKFFGSNEYKEEQRSLLRYLQLEGFDVKQEEFTIEYRGRKWLISITQKDK